MQLVVGVSMYFFVLRLLIPFLSDKLQLIVINCYKQMIRRAKPDLLKLQKISQASSPSPSREVSQQQYNTHRINPLFLTPISAPKLQSHPSQEERNSKLTILRQEIMDRQRRLNLWDQAQHNRNSSQGNLPNLLLNLVQGIVKMAVESKNLKHSILKIIKSGKKGILEWILSWVRQLFWLISLALTQHHIHKH